MRIAFCALAACGISVSAALAGGGTVTSTDAGPKTLTVDTTGKILEAMSVELPATAASIVYAAPPPAPAEKKTEAKPPKETKVAAASAPLTPRETVQQCATCHGYDGLARIPTAPNIAGSSRQYLETQLKAFRAGKRESEVMSVIAEDLSNADIKVVAKWYASLKVTVEGGE